LDVLSKILFNLQKVSDVKGSFFLSSNVVPIAGKFGAVFASIPLPIFAALYCIFFAYVGT
jgi:hypothetical protein